MRLAHGKDRTLNVREVYDDTRVHAGGVYHRATLDPVVGTDTYTDFWAVGIAEGVPTPSDGLNRFWSVLQRVRRNAKDGASYIGTRVTGDTITVYPVWLIHDREHAINVGTHKEQPSIVHLDTGEVLPLED